MKTLAPDHAAALSDLRENVERLTLGERSRDGQRRERDRSIVEAHAAGVPTSAIAEACGISSAMIRRIVQDAREGGKAVEL